MTSDKRTNADEGPFTDFGQYGPGQLDLRVLDQGTWWVDIHGRPHAIATMSASYITNVIALCHDNAVRFHIAHVLQRASDYLDAVLTGQDSSHAADILVYELGLSPSVWLAQTPLLLALQQALPAPHPNPTQSHQR